MEWTRLVRISERTDASLTRVRIRWSRASTPEAAPSLLTWDVVADWGIGSESTALDSVECDRFVAG